MANPDCGFAPSAPGEGPLPLAGKRKAKHSVSMRSEEELAMLVNGLDLKQTRQRNWYRKSA